MINVDLCHDFTVNVIDNVSVFLIVLVISALLGGVVKTTLKDDPLKFH